MPSYELDGDSPSDLFLRVTDDEYSYQQVTITNASEVAALTVALGHPVAVNGTLILAAGIAAEGGTLKGLVAKKTIIPAGGTAKVAALMRGPAILREGGLPLEDHAGDAFDMTKFKSEIAKLSPLILVKAELTNVTTQST